MNAKEVSELKAGDVVYDYNGIYKIIGTYDSFHKWYKVHNQVVDDSGDLVDDDNVNDDYMTIQELKRCKKD